MEDLLECIFGDFASSSEKVKRQSNTFEALGDGRYRIDASMTIEEFNHLIGADFDDEDVETVAGMLLHEFGELPTEGQSIEVGKFEFAVTSVAGNRIRAAVVRAISQPPATPAIDGERTDGGGEPRPRSLDDAATAGDGGRQANG